MNNFETYLESVFDYLPNDTTVNAMYYALLNPGKRVRSQLFFKTLQSFGVEKTHYEIAAAIEMIHTYSLIHDDLPAMDNATLRRGKKCVHIEYNEAIAILAGDGLLTESFHQIEISNIENDLKLKILKEIINAAGCNGMIYGQELDILNENKELSVDQINEIHDHKTGALIALPVKLACLIAGKDEYIEKITVAMKKFGLAFQVKDDLLDGADVAVLGKDSSDIDLNKSTYLRLLGRAQSEQYYHTLLSSCFEILNELPISLLPLITYLQSLIDRKS